MQTVDDMQTLFVRLQRLNRLRQLPLCQRLRLLQPLWNARPRIEALVLHKENDAFRCRTTRTQLDFTLVIDG